MNIKLQNFVVLFSFSFILFSANATLLLKENFSYTSGKSLEAEKTWDAMDFHFSLGTGTTKGAFPILVENGALTYTGYPESGIGNKVKLEAMPGEDLYRIFPRIDAPTLINPASSAYASFLVNVSSATTAGDWFFHLSSNPILKSIFHGRVSVKKNESNKLAFGIYRVQGSKVVWTDFIYDMNATHLVVIKYNFVSAGVQDLTGDDVCSIIVNPAIASSEPATGWLVATGETGAEAYNMVGAVCVRQSTNGPTATLSNIRVTDNWTDLMDNTKALSGIQLATDDAIKTGFEATTTAPSAAQTFKVSATGLSSDLLIYEDVLPSLYELSLDGTNYSDILAIQPSMGVISERNVYIRHKMQLEASETKVKMLILNSIPHNATYISCSGLVKLESGVNQISSELDLKVINGNITVSNVNLGETINIYNQLGQRVYTAIVTDKIHTCTVNTKGIMLIQSGAKFSKIIIK